MSVFYTTPELIGNEYLTIEGPEAHHIHKVMRLKNGESIMVVDGIGNSYRAEIGKYAAGCLTCNIISRIRNYGEPSKFVTLAAGLSVGTKFDEIIQKGTELGISRFIPLITEKSKVKLNDPKKVKARLARWKKVAIASMKQSERSVLPEILEAVIYDSLFQSIGDLGQMLLFDPSGEKTVYDLNAEVWDDRVTLIVGPESGFSVGEVELARENKAIIINFGRRILRTENAAPTACAVIMQLLGEFR